MPPLGYRLPDMPHPANDDIACPAHSTFTSFITGLTSGADRNTAFLSRTGKSDRSRCISTYFIILYHFHHNNLRAINPAKALPATCTTRYSGTVKKYTNHIYP